MVHSKSRGCLWSLRGKVEILSLWGLPDEGVVVCFRNRFEYDRGVRQSDYETDSCIIVSMKEYESGGPEELSSSHHTNRIFSVKCMPTDKNIFFSGGWDETVHVWDVRVGSGSVRKFPGPSISADSLDYKNGVLLAGNYQNNDMIQLYDFGSGKLL